MDKEKMTVTPTELATIFARLERLETRQNLLKNNLLSLKKQVDTLATTFQERPELSQIQQLQASIEQLARFGDRLDTPVLSSPISPEPKPTSIDIDGIDPDVLVMPILEGDSELEAALDADLDADLSTLLDTINSDDNDVLDSLIDTPLVMESGDMLVDDGVSDGGDRPLKLDLDNLDLANISLDELAQLDIYALGGLDDDPLDSVSLADEGLDPFSFADGLEDLGGLETASQLPPLNQAPLPIEASNGMNALNDAGIPLETLDLDPLAMNAIDLEDLSQSEMVSLLDTGFENLTLKDNELSDLELAVDNAPTLDLDAEMPATEPTVELPSLENLAIAEDLGELAMDMDDLELEIAAEMPSYDGMMDFETAIDEPIPNIAENLLDPPSLNVPTSVVEPPPEIPEVPTENPVIDDELMPEAEAIVTPETGGEMTAKISEVEAIVPPESIPTEIEIPVAEEPIAIPDDHGAIAEPSPPVAERAPIIDTEDPEELAIAADTGAETEIPVNVEAELTAAEILTRINNRQHYFIGFQIPHIQLSQQNLRDCVFDKTNLQDSSLQNSDLRDTSFRESNLRNANLEFTSLERASFEKADLRNAKFKGILFNSRTNFQGANLEGADFSGLDLTRSPDFKRANLSQTKFEGVNLRGVNCRSWNLAGASLRNANLIDTNLRQTNLSDADLTGAIYSLKTVFPRGYEVKGALLVTAGADLTGQDLSGYDLSELDLTKVNLSNANLEQTNFERCDLTDANLSGANLRRSQLRAICLEANFTGANLTQADLSESNVTGSKFTDANFEQAILKDANFTMTDLRGAQFKDADTYRLNCNGANLESMDLTGLNFEGDLSGANLSKTKLCGLNLNFLDLSWANLTDADVTGATFKETNLENANLRGAKGFEVDSYDYKIYLNNIILPDGQTLD